MSRNLSPNQPVPTLSHTRFIGLGIMGRPMAGHLLSGGHAVFVHNRSPVARSVLDAGAVACGSARAVAERSEVVITMLPDTPDVEAVLFGAGGVAEGLSPGKVVVDMSSISPVATKDLARRVNALGCDYLDAPVSGGEVGVSLPNTTACQELFSACAAQGGSAWDHSGLVRAFERLACYEIGENPACRSRLSSHVAARPPDADVRGGCRRRGTRQVRAQSFASAAARPDDLGRRRQGSGGDGAGGRGALARGGVRSPASWSPATATASARCRVWRW